MYQRVTTARQQKAFAKTWEYFCRKYGWLNDPYAKKGMRYNLLLDKSTFFQRKKVIGTVEFIPYDPNNPESTIEPHCPFSDDEGIRLHQARTWEIDKLCIHEDFQKKGHFNQFIAIFFAHMKATQPKFYIGLMEEKFFRMLRMSFGLKVVQQKEKIVSPQTTLVPILFDVEQFLSDSKRVDHLQNISAKRINGY
ncbi:hypothetical protein GCM10011391_06560 [Pullulanibacillus camelliae]|uniref:Uncharacterized protein n=1 Tax=Pullulanibacillus camelliae TaxID=1707096 RepID=A0A8J2VMJ6_9BACL|nr:hypothetical protein [Pullulanibacillus camelliae]GGE30578.1 hypothetical protein GCM10011391_06560 [Pullulanibacillus camelliae]